MRSLVSYGAVISNLANVSQTQRIEISTIAKHLIAMEPFTDLSTSVSKVLMKVIGAHKCLCQDCDPKYHEQRQVGIVQEVQAVYEAGVSEEEKNKSRSKIIKKCEEEILTKVQRVMDTAMVIVENRDSKVKVPLIGLISSGEDRDIRGLRQVIKRANKGIRMTTVVAALEGVL